ncbi:unnamed protein product [Linum tenue]|uniref:Uncharacterized protein n=1 Tax=Linum tenue TaxID=586396 RepID=A0AAV0K253_9ROSI|nr:unnamed protein product [Linum tenue]
MVLFDFKSDKHFVTSSDKTTLRVCELSDPSIHPSLIRNAHWREVGNITVDSDDDDDRDVDDLAEERYYDGLLFFDGHGMIEGQEALTRLAQQLTRLGLMVSPGGCCFQDVTELREHKEFGIHYLRLNDLFNWSNHGVYSAKIGMWQRLELKYTVPKHKKISKSPMAVGVVSKEKYEELRRMLNEKKEELKKVTTEMEDEIQKLRDDHEEELQKVQQEMEAAIDKRDAELRKVKKEKGEELRNLRKEKDEEIRKLRREMCDEVERLEREKDELTSKQLDQKKDKEETVHQPGKEQEMKMLRREANDLKKQVKEKDEELLKLRRELGQLERYSNNSWTNLGSVKYVATGYGRLRKRVPREKFERYSEMKIVHGCHRYAPHTTAFSAFPRLYIGVLDEVSTDHWPLPPSVKFLVGNGGQFDVDNWWFMKTSHPEGGTTMLAFYDGSLSSCADVGYTCNTRLSYPRGRDFYADRSFFLVSMDSEWRLAFTYRE